MDVTGYVTAFKRCVQRLDSPLSDPDLLDRFVRGLHGHVAKEVLLSMPATFEDACSMAERVAAVLRFTSSRGRQWQEQKPGNKRVDTSDTRVPGGHGPMVLGYQRGQGR